MGIHEHTIRNWEERGIPRAVCPPGSGFRRFPREYVLALAQHMRACLDRHPSEPGKPEENAVAGTYDDEEAAELRDYVQQTCEVEAVALKRAAMRGLRKNRIYQGMLAYLNGSSSGEAARIAGLPRAQFLNGLMERGVAILRDLSSVHQEVAFAAQVLGNDRLPGAVARFKETHD